MENKNDKKMLICYSEETINKIVEVANQLEVRGITNVTGLAAILNLLNAPIKTIEDNE